MENLHGQLSTSTVPVVMRTLQARGGSGALVLSRDAHSTRIRFRAGAVVAATSSAPEEAFGAFLVTTGRISSADLGHANRKHEEGAPDLPRALLLLGLLTAQELSDLRLQHAAMVLASTLTWNSGHYVFEEEESGSDEPDGSQPAGTVLILVLVIIEAARLVRDPETIRSVVGSGQSTLQAGGEVEDAAEKVFSSEERLVLALARSRLDGKTTTEALAGESPLSAEATSRCLYVLVCAGLLGLDSQIQPLSAGVATQQTAATAGPDSDLLDHLVEPLELLPDESASQVVPSGERKRIGRYVIEKTLGRGAMGAVFLAQDPDIDRTVAIKVIQTAVQLDDDQRERYERRFRQEAKAAGKLMHPGIVTVFDVGRDEAGAPFIVMEYVEGRTLAEVLAGGKLGYSEAVRISLAILEALGHAHSYGIVHRDIKPANILITTRGQVKIMDFGIAHVPGSEMTQANELLGSPLYMAPEQLSQAEIDGRTDLFAFGVVLYKMVTGKAPFEGGSLAGIVTSVLTREPPPPEQIVAEVPPSLSRIILRCLAKDRLKRFKDTGEVRAALLASGAAPQDTAEHTTVSSRPPLTAPGPAGPRVASKPAARPATAGWPISPKTLVLLAFGAGVFVLMVVGLMITVLRNADPAPSTRPPTAVRPSSTAPGASSAPGGGPWSRPQAADAAQLYYQATQAYQQGDLDTSKTMLDQLREQAPEFSGAADLQQKVKDGLWARNLPFAFEAKHDHRFGDCRGRFTLHPWGIEYVSRKHGSWRWPFRSIRSMEWHGSRKIKITTFENTVLKMVPKSYNFALRSGEILREDWERYKRFARQAPEP